MSGYYDRDGNPMSMAQWSAVFMDFAYKVVARTDLPGGCWVSTVWLGLDHSYGMGGPPLIFETMVFPSHDDRTELDMMRYSTLEEAQLGHAEMVTRWTGWTPGDDYPEDRELSPIGQFIEMLQQSEHATSPDSMTVMYPKADGVADRLTMEEEKE